MAHDTDEQQVREERGNNQGPAARRRAKRTRRMGGVGAFVIITLVLFALGIFLIGDRRALFGDDFHIYTEFPELGGIQNGAIVRVAGMDAGEVVEIRVPRTPAEQFRVKLRIIEDLHGLVRTDSVASLQSDGLVGNIFVQVESGSADAPQAPEGSTIRGRELYGFEDLFRQASETMGAVNSLVTKLQSDVDQIVATAKTVLSAVEGLADDAGSLLARLQRDLDVLLREARSVMTDVKGLIDRVKAGEGSLGKFLNDDELYKRALTLVDDAKGVIAKVSDAAEEAKQAVSEFRTKEGPVQGVIADLRQTLTFARDATGDLADATAALKRSFFLRGFFERRGYYDLNDITPRDYREGALLADRRQVVRVWLGQDVLFETEPDGDLVLTEGGKVRLESAMSEFLDYPKDAPLVVEGYADAPTDEVQFLRSRARAALVRDFLVSRFNLDANRVGLMPLGREAPGSPQGDRWEGVALALFIKPPPLQ